MCRLERNTASLGRSPVPTTRRRTRLWRRRRASRFVRALAISCLSSGSQLCRSLGGLPGLATDHLAGVADALPLVRVGPPQMADLRGHLADLLLVDALDREAGRRGDLECDALRGLDRNLVRVAEAEHQIVALDLDTVAHALDLELLLEAVGDPLDHVGHQRAGEPVQRAVLTLVVRALDLDDVALPLHRDGLRHLLAQRAPGPRHRDGVALLVELDARRELDGEVAD